VGRVVTSAVAIRGVSKTFGATRALDGVDLDLVPGEVHALLGCNGSGKSTLIKILAGAQAPDAGGSLGVGGAWRSWAGWDSEHARAAGMRFVHQDPCLFPSLSVAENLAADGAMARAPLAPIHWRRLRRRSRTLMESFELDVDPRAPLATLGPAQQAMVAIARALRDVEEAGSNAVLVLDEPTASLPRHEVELLLGVVRRLAAKGHMVLYVTHRLDEVFAVTDRVTVLRNGRVVTTRPTAQLDEDALVELITGRRIEQAARGVAPTPSGRPALAVERLSSARLRDVSFELHPGEILGVAGMVGSGRTELLRVLCGDRRRTGGSVALHGEPVAFHSPLEAMEAGVVYVPEDRRESVFAGMSVDENLAAASLDSYWSGGRLRAREQRHDSHELVDQFSIVASSVRQPLRSLSGGNQQKVVLARWLRTEPHVLLLDEPSQGVDVGARADIYRLVRQATAGGAAAIVVASDLQELAQVADRVLVLRDGAVVAEMHSPQLDPTTLNDSLYRTKEQVTE